MTKDERELLLWLADEKLHTIHVNSDFGLSPEEKEISKTIERVRFQQLAELLNVE